MIVAGRGDFESDGNRDPRDESIRADHDQLARPAVRHASDGRGKCEAGRGQRRELAGAAPEPVDPRPGHSRDQAGADDGRSQVASLVFGRDVGREQVEPAVAASGRRPSAGCRSRPVRRLRDWSGSSFVQLMGSDRSWIRRRHARPPVEAGLLDHVALEVEQGPCPAVVREGGESPVARRSFGGQGSRRTGGENLAGRGVMDAQIASEETSRMLSS